ncbi:hypothetical protein HAPAU_36930 [Halalkalicoccus paucihalophilus]|uniref:Uncharacterized protein n=1 Tax=Halalkalicoccus paucihalophilus TaxID=1008153 RepID=A0A151A9Q4_9EURY|nr:hypothetical protein HAPAU_36930 [Halalkalicoccus paucihalophilus]
MAFIKLCVGTNERVIWLEIVYKQSLVIIPFSCLQCVLGCCLWEHGPP